MAAWAVTNLISGGTITQIIALSQNGVVKAMYELLEKNLGATNDNKVCVIINY
jgi:hypothetical protein